MHHGEQDQLAFFHGKGGIIRPFPPRFQEFPDGRGITGLEGFAEERRRFPVFLQAAGCRAGVQKGRNRAIQFFQAFHRSRIIPEPGFRRHRFQRPANGGGLLRRVSTLRNVIHQSHRAHAPGLVRQQGRLFPQGCGMRSPFHQVKYTSPGIKQNHRRQHAHAMFRRTGQAAAFFPIFHGGTFGHCDKLHVTDMFIQRTAFFRSWTERLQPAGFRRAGFRGTVHHQHGRRRRRSRGAGSGGILRFRTARNRRHQRQANRRNNRCNLHENCRLQARRMVMRL